eukprot:940791-Rhodomonas_salina.2
MTQCLAGPSAMTSTTVYLKLWLVCLLAEEDGAEEGGVEVVSGVCWTVSPRKKERCEQKRCRCDAGTST